MIRAAAIIVCSCGAKFGNAPRAAMHEDMDLLERGMLVGKVPVMVRHWRMGHKLTCQAPEFADVIRIVAARIAADAEKPVEPLQIDDTSPIRCGTFR